MKKTRDSERTRSAVMRAAERLFAERGFAGTSMRDLAEASGISQPLIHHHFGSKDALYHAVKDRALRQLDAWWRRHGGNGRPADLQQAVRLLVECFRRNPRLLRLLSWARLEGDPSLWPGEIELRSRRQDPVMLAAVLLVLLEGAEA